MRRYTREGFAGTGIEAMNEQLMNQACPDAIADASALVIAGNRQILHHAVAALEHFDVPTEKAILVVSSASLAYREAVLRSAEPFRWAYIFSALVPPHSNWINRLFPMDVARTFKLSFYRHLQALRRGTRFFRQVARVNTVPLRLIISGFYGHPLVRSACSMIPHGEFVLVDDGNMTREVARQRVTEQRAGFMNALQHNSTFNFTGAKGRAKLFLFKKIAGALDRGSPAVTFFTHYHDIPVGGEDRLIKYEPVRHARMVPTLPNTVHFLGMPALRRKIVDPEAFAHLLDAVEKRFRGTEFHYYGHPFEGDEEFRLVRQHIPYAQILPNRAPYEQEYIHMASVPAVVAGFYSSTIFNLVARGDLRTRIEFLEIPMQWVLLATRRERLQHIYQDAKQQPKIHYIPFDCIAPDGGNMESPPHASTSMLPENGQS
jgi:hypothetical protein